MSQVHVEWDAPDSGGAPIDGYEVSIRTDGGAGTEVERVLPCDSAQCDVDITGGMAADVNGRDSTARKRALLSLLRWRRTRR